MPLGALCHRAEVWDFNGKDYHLAKLVLTYSEMRSWKQCRLQHDYRYRQCLSPKCADAA